MNIFSTWQFNLVGYLICIVGFFQFYKLAVRNVVKDGAATVMLQIIAGVSVLVLTPFFALKFPNEPKYYLLLLAACVFYAINDRLQTTARKNLQVSVFTIVNQFRTIFLFVYGLTLFKEAFSLNKLLGILMSLSGMVEIPRL